jgi:hypothetical protein
MAAQHSLEDLLSAVTDALLAEDTHLDAVIARYDVPRSNVDAMVSLIRRLHRTLVGVNPSPRFVQKLKHDLIGTPETGLVARLRYLPARVQIAAGVVAVAGFMLLARRRLLDLAAVTTGGSKDEAEASAAQ